MATTPPSAYQPKPTVGQISGFTNFNEAQHYAYAQWLDGIKHVFELYGFTPLIPRPVELRDNLHVKGGMAKQIYSIARTNEDGTLAADGRPNVVGTDIGLPFDRTVPLALWVAQYANEMTLPFKRHDIGWVFRGETAQAGRFRGFHQADVDIIGRQLGVAADVECMMAIGQALVKLGIGGITMHVNHIAIAKGLLRRVGVTAEQEAQVLRIIDKLEKVPAEKLKPEISAAAPQLTAAVIDQLIAVFQFRGSTAAFRPVLEQACAGDADIMAGFAHLVALETLFAKQQDIPLFHPFGAPVRQAQGEREEQTSDRETECSAQALYSQNVSNDVSQNPLLLSLSKDASLEVGERQINVSNNASNPLSLPAGHSHLGDGWSLSKAEVRQDEKERPITLVVNPGLVRGLDYYTGVVVETFVAGYEQFGSVASGGRYSNLIASFSNKHEDIEGVGFSIGVTRLFDVLCRAKALPLERKTTADVLIAYRAETLDQAFGAAQFLRAHGQKVDMYSNPARPMKHQLEYASKKGMPLVLMLMSDEGSPQVAAYVLKNLATRQQTEWATQEACFAELAGHVVK